MRAVEETEELWERARPVGRPRLFETSEELWEACVRYFKWIKENPLLGVEAKTVSVGNNGGSEVELVSIPKMHAMTKDGLCIFLGISEKTWRVWRTEEKFCLICEIVETIIRDRMFSGAAAGLLNHAIVARKLGMVDKHELGGPNGGPIPIITTEMTAQEAAEAYTSALHEDDGDN